MKSINSKLNRRRRNRRVAVILDNFVDKDLQSMLFPLNLMQIIQFCPKYRIRDNYITPNSRLSNFVSLCYTMLIISALFYELYYFYLSPNEVVSKHSTLMYHITELILFTLGFLMNLTVNIFYTIENISFVLKFQEIHKYLNNLTNFKSFTIINWFVVILFIGQSIFVSLYMGFILKTTTHLTLSIGIVVCFQTNIVYAIRIIQILKEKVDLWNTQVLQYKNMGDRDTQDYCKTMFQAYVNILNCFDIWKVSYQVMIVFQSTLFFYQYLVRIEIYIQFVKRIGISRMVLVITGLLMFWIIKSLALQIALTIYCEKFYIAMTNVQSSCELILHSNCSDAEKRLYKNVKRLHRVTFDKLDACRIFYVDATLPLKIIMLCANYTFVLLQFAFL